MFVDGFLDLLDAGILKREVDGALLHAGFFVGPKSHYQRLRDMPPELLAKLQMTAISFTNELYGDQERKTRGRVRASFINNALMATLLGAVVSDGLENGRVISGVGGQHNFVTQAFALPDARSILTVKSTRRAGGKLQSNIRWNYGHTTIPRHERDIVISEYGIADLRGKPDAAGRDRRDACHRRQPLPAGIAAHGEGRRQDREDLRNPGSVSKQHAGAD